MTIPVQHVITSVHEAASKTEKLLLLVGGPGSGKSKILREMATMRGWKYVDARTLVTEEILEMSPKMRPQQAPNKIEESLDILHAEVILIDNVEVFMAPVVNLEPLALVKQISKKHTVVVGWPGDYYDGKLVLDYNGQRHECVGDISDTNIVVIA